MVLASEICKGYRHHFLALDHLREAERMMRLEKPALAAEIAKQKQAFAARGQQADWQGLAMALSLLRGTENPDDYLARLLVVGHLHEAEEEALQEHPELAAVIRDARKAYQSEGVEPDFAHLEKALQSAEQ